MSALVGKKPGDIIDDVTQNQFQRLRRCGDCGAKRGRRHEAYCRYSVCRRSGLTAWGGRECYCFLGPEYDYQTGALITADRPASRVDPPGSRVTAVPPAAHDRFEDDGDGNASCQRDVPFRGYLPDTLLGYGTGLTMVRRMAEPKKGYASWYSDYVDPDTPGAVVDVFCMSDLKERHVLVWNSARLEWQWNDRVAAHIASRASTTKVLARSLLLASRGRAELLDAEQRPGEGLLLRLVESGRGDVAGHALSFFRGEQRLAFYGIQLPGDVYRPPFSDDYARPQREREILQELLEQAAAAHTEQNGTAI